ncbi:MAG TPA: transaldolase [Longimicrobium sp.]|nr:transaldolase [Longimicrobium sp.]
MPENAKTPLHDLQPLGQSVWLDYIRREILENGEMAAMIGRYDLRGVTSNPSIFEEAIAKSDDYDSALEEMAARGVSGGDAYESVAIADIQAACDLFRPVYDAAEGHDGFVSLEVSPELAHSFEATLEEARRLWKAVDRPNLMVKVPGNEGGVPAVEELIADGINVNVTLLFSISGYERIMEAYLRGTERRVEQGGDVERVASVASFFISRVDTAIDARLDKIVAEGGEKAERARALLGKAAIANAKLAYERFTQVFSGDRWERLSGEGARVQRPLWASTSTKSPTYRDVVYVEELVGPHTVNTMPLATIKAFADHGVARRGVDQDLDGARQVMAELKELGIDLDDVTETLQSEGVDKFAKSFSGMMKVVGEKLARVAAAS